VVAGRGRGRQAVADTVFALLAFAATSIGFASWYSRGTFQPGLFDSLYHSGIYRYRVLGRDLVWWVYQNLVHTNVLAGNSKTIELDDPGQLYPAFLIVNGIAFIGLVLTLRFAARRARVAEPGATFMVWTVATIVALSSYVITPYDNISYFVLLGFVMLATSDRRDLRWLAVAVAGLGMLDRESMLIGIPALVAIYSTRTEDRDLRTVIVGSGAVMGAVYVVLRITSDGSGSAIWATVLIGDQIESLRGWAGIALVGAVAFVWEELTRLVGLTDRAGRPVAIFYLLSAPYLAVILLTGQWFELRLVMPLLLGDLAVRCTIRAYAVTPRPDGTATAVLAGATPSS
jgi:hypothetical protein